MRRSFYACLGSYSLLFMSAFQNGYSNHGDEKIVISFDGGTEKRSRSRLTWRAMEAKIRRLLAYFERAHEVVDNDFQIVSRVGIAKNLPLAGESYN